MFPNMTIKDLRENNLILLECISGSKAYGLDTAKSDTDIKGVFLLPIRQFYGLNYIKQINNETNDFAFYELRRFMELLSVNNPNILELLNTPDDCVIKKHPILSNINTDKILSKKCKDTFGKFALSQIKKAKGLNKKILNPLPKERKTPLDFCYVNNYAGSISLAQFLKNNSWKQSACGLVKIPHMKDIYGLYYSEDIEYNGIIKNYNSNELILSSIPKNQKLVKLLYFNQNGYSSYCKDYKEYWEWVKNRNEDRYLNTLNHNKNYDSKNIMHTFRLLNMAIEIAQDNTINVYRKDREFLLDIKSGQYEYEELLKMANKKYEEMEDAFNKSDLPAEPDISYIEHLTFDIRNEIYNN